MSLLLRDRGSRRRWNRAILSAQICNQLQNLLIGKRLAEWRHLGPAVENLGCYFFVGPSLLFANLRERRSLFGAFEIGAVAESAAFIAKENSPCRLLRLRV